jgi:hypothetical protein
MKNVLALAMFATLVWFGHAKYKAASESDERAGFSATAASPPKAQLADTSESAQFTCDGRTRCSQMTSCAEATYFIQHCPNTKMDGDNDGVPCEQQWCQ